MNNWPAPDPSSRVLTWEEKRQIIVRDARRNLGGWYDYVKKDDDEG